MDAEDDLDALLNEFEADNLAPANYADASSVNPLALANKEPVV